MVLRLVLRSEMSQSNRISSLISMMDAPTATTWLEVAFLIEETVLDLETFNTAARWSYMLSYTCFFSHLN